MRPPGVMPSKPDGKGSQGGGPGRRRPENIDRNHTEDHNAMTAALICITLGIACYAVLLVALTRAAGVVEDGIEI